MGDRSGVYRKLRDTVRKGNLEKIQNLIDRYGLSYLLHGSQGYLLLREATRQKQTEVAKLLLRNGCRVNSKSINPSMTPLHFATQNDDVDVVQMLLDKGAHVDINNGDGRTPLIMAIEGGNSLIAEHLFSRGASVHNAPSSPNYPRRLLLHIACEKNNDKLVETLLRNHACAYVNVKDRNGITPLHIALQHGNLKVVEQLLIYGADIDSACILGGKEGYTALHLAAQTGNEEIIKLLLSKGSIIDARTEDKLTPLHVAIENARETAVRIYLENGADVNAKSVDNQTPLNLAVEQSSLTIIRQILRYKPDSSDEYNRLALCSAVRECGPNSEKIVTELLDYGLAISPQDIIDGSLLYAAVENGYEKIVEDLLKYGADANYSVTKTLGKWSLLHTAAKKGRYSIIKLLINYGADVNSKDSTGRTPVYLAVENQNLEATKQLLDNKAHIEDHFDLLFTAVLTDNTEIVATLLNFNVDINAKNINGKPMLHPTLFSKHTYGKELLDLLENKKANVHAARKNDETVLHIAIRRKQKEMVKFLLDHTVDINTVLNNDITPLHLAALTGSESITTMILDKGANINAAQENGVTALYIACAKGHDKVVEILLKSGADLNYGGKNGGVLLHVATEEGHTEVVEVLLRYDADIDLKNDEGETALHIASQKGYADLIHILLEHGSDINNMTKCQFTAFDLASSSSSSTPVYDSDFAMDKRGFPDKGKVIEYLQRHMIKLTTANLYLNEKSICSIDSYEFRDFRTDCEKEIEDMKSEKISNNISFYDILTKGINRLTAYSINENVMKALSTDDYKTKFPIYASMINLQFKKGIKRNDLLEQSYRSFDILCDSFSRLPPACVDDIFTYLSNYDLKKLINTI